MFKSLKKKQVLISKTIPINQRLRRNLSESVRGSKMKEIVRMENRIKVSQKQIICKQNQSNNSHYQHLLRCSRLSSNQNRFSRKEAFPLISRKVSCLLVITPMIYCCQISLQQELKLSKQMKEQEKQLLKLRLRSRKRQLLEFFIILDRSIECSFNR